MIAGSSVRSSARRPAARKSATTSVASVAEPPLPSASSVPPASSRARSSLAAASSSASRALGQRLLAQRADLVGLHHHRARDVREQGVDVRRLVVEERVEEARRAAARALAPAVLEEHVHELPQQVVVGLGQLLADERVVARRRRDRDVEAARRRLAVERDHHVVRPGQQRRLRRAPERDRRQRALADDHRVHELHRDVLGVRARGRRRADGKQPAAAQEALGHLVAEPRDPLRLRAEERAIGLAASDDEVGRRARLHAGAPVLVASFTSQSRTSSIPSPVRALTSIRGTPGWTPSRW